MKELRPNATLSHYRIVRELGAGGMGEVYLAQDTKLDRRVALKILPVEVATNSDRMRRFVQEAKAASALNHPNIITIYEIEQSDLVNFIATEFIDGETLRDRMRHAPMILGEVLDVAAQIAGALSAAHAAGIVHRDIKPENIMLRRDGIVKVLDFGLVKLTERLPPDSVDTEAPTSFKTDPGTVVGTAVYMSPEQARGVDVDARTDIFSLGVLIYEMIAGRLPFEGSNTNEILASILSDKEPLPLARYAREVPAELERIVSKTLRKNRDERYQTIKDLAIDLKTLRQELEFDRKLERSAAPKSKSAEGKGEVAEAGTNMESAARLTVVERGPTSATKFNQRSVAIALAALMVIASGGGAYFYFLRAHGGAIDSVAVMPFVNESGNADVEYLSDGMTETLISSLSQLPHLSVKARSTVFRYKGKATDAKTIGKELNVQAILNGRVVQRGDQLTLSLELIDAQTENVIWSEQYNRKPADLVSLQSELARDVSSKLKTKLSRADEQKIAKTYTTNAGAYRLYLQGRFFWNKREEKDFRKAVEYFNQAIALDPNYALAYSGLADAYALLSGFGFTPPAEGMTKAREFALQALSLDNGLAEPHATLGYVLKSFHYDFAGAEREFKRAIELNPNYATVHQWYGELLTNAGRFDEASTEYRRGLEIDPLLLPLNWDYGRFLYMSRRYDESLAQHKKTIELDPGFARAHRTLAELNRIKGDYANAIEEQAKFFELSGEPQKAALLRENFAKSGWNGYLRLVTAENSPLEENNWVVARAYVELGEKDKAFAELNKAYESRRSVTWLKVDPLFDPLRSDPRFQELLKKIGFPQ
jgi:serine/threonine protein kinase/TolB-like protein